MIEVIKINKSFEGRKVLDNVSVSFAPGKTNLIIGRSGSGKTVLLKAIIGLHETDSGEIWYGDTLFSALDFKARKEIRRQMGVLFQGSALFDSLSVEANVMFPLDMFSDMTYREKVARVKFCLDRVNILDSNKLFPSELSGGMKKRVAIARAISLNPRFLFCDEPNSGLDPLTAILIDELIKEITKEFCMTTIINTHDMNSVLETGEKVVFINDGVIHWEGTRDDILNSDSPSLNEFVFASAMARKLRDGNTEQQSL